MSLCIFQLPSSRQPQSLQTRMHTLSLDEVE